MKSIEYMTARVLAKRGLNLNLGRDAVLWADLLLAQGLEFGEIKTLITLDAKASPAQVEKAVDDCLSKLGIALPDEKTAHLLLIWSEIQKLLKSESGVHEFLESTQKFCVDFGHEPLYMQFYLLSCAHKDLAKGGAIVFHDREVNEQNFENILRWEIDLFLEEYEPRLLERIKVRSVS